MTVKEFNKKAKEFLPISGITAQPIYIVYDISAFGKTTCTIIVERDAIARNWEETLFHMSEDYFRCYYALIKECIAYEKDMFS